MPRSTALVAAVAAALLLVGVVAVRSGTAAEDVDLAGPAPEPSAGPSEPPWDGVVLEANGLPGLRLGTRPAGVVPWEEGACDPVWDRAGVVSSTSASWQAAGWVRDGRLVSVVLSTWLLDPQVDPLLRTWLGPTLGSPSVAARELPGARPEVHRPFGADGPTVTVTVVPLDGVEVVYGDAPVGVGGPGQSDQPVITSIEVRRPEARACETTDTMVLAGVESTDLDVDAGGAGPVRLGAPVQPLIDSGVLLEDGQASGGADPPCRWLSAGDLPLSVQAVDGRVVEVSVHAEAPGAFGLAPGAGVDELVETFPELAGQQELLGWDHSAEVDLGPASLRVDLFPEVRYVPELDQPVLGGEAQVAGYTLRAPEPEAPAYC